LRKAAALLLALALAGCASSGVDVETLSSNSDRVIWDAAQTAYSKKNWESARQHYQRIIDAFPNSEFGPGARLGLADSHFTEGGAAGYILAIAEYRDFLTLYPSHPRADYAQFQVAEAYFKQKNNPDRDQVPTELALDEYQRLLDIYPQSPYVEPTRGRIQECRQSLAKAEFLAGYFYQKTRQAWRAAILRYEGIVSDYPDYQEFDLVLFRMAECLAAAGRKAEALPHLGRLLAEYPTSSYTDDAQALMRKLQAEQGADAPPAPPVPVPTSPQAPASPKASAPPPGPS